MRLNRQELATGAVFIAIGLFFGLSTYYELPIGSALRMGPGFFPILLSSGLVLVGLVVAARGFKASAVAVRPVPWRGLAILLPLPFVFGLAIRPFGLVPTVFLVVFAAAFASRWATIRMALILATILTVFCVIVFHYALRLPLPLFGSLIEPLLRVGE